MTIHTRLFGYSFAIDREKMVIYDEQEKDKLFEIYFGLKSDGEIAKELSNWLSEQNIETEEFDILLSLVKLREKVGGSEYILKLTKSVSEENVKEKKSRKSSRKKKKYIKICIGFFLPYEKDLFSSVIDMMRSKKQETIDFNLVRGSKSQEVFLECEDDVGYHVIELSTSKLTSKEFIKSLENSEYLIVVLDAKSSEPLVKLATTKAILTSKEIILISLGWNPIAENTKKKLFKQGIPYGFFICSDHNCIKEKLVKILSRLICPSPQEVTKIIL